MFDNTETDSLELLRFYPSLTAIDGFEEALHDRVRQVGRLPDHAFPLIVAVERLEGDGALALVSTHTPGKRLSTFFDRPGPRKGLNPSFVTGVVTQVIQALTVFGVLLVASSASSRSRLPQVSRVATAAQRPIRA